MNDPRTKIAETLSVPEAARLLGIGRNEAYAAVNAGEIPALRIGRRVLVPKVALKRLLEAPPPLGRSASGR